MKLKILKAKAGKLREDVEPNVIFSFRFRSTTHWAMVLQTSYLSSYQLDA